MVFCFVPGLRLGPGWRIRGALEPSRDGAREKAHGKSTERHQRQDDGQQHLPGRRVYLSCGFAPGHLASVWIETDHHPPHIAPEIVVALGRSAERRLE